MKKIKLALILGVVFILLLGPGSMGMGANR